MYHRVALESFDPWGLAVSPENFARQLRWLRENRTVMSLTDFAAGHRDGTLPENAAALTFDDGYCCVAEAAAPLLSEQAMPATVFLPAELIERERPFWWDELERIVLQSDRENLVLDGEAVALGRQSAEDRKWRPGAPPATPRQAAFHRIWAKLRPMPPAAIDSAVADLREQAAVAEERPASKRPMSPREVRNLAGSGIEFGSHALTHPWLASLDAREKAREIGETIARCETLTGIRPASFAYPYGNFDAEAVRLVEEAGFLCACSTERRSVSQRSSRFALPRVQVGDWDAIELRMELQAVGI